MIIPLRFIKGVMSDVAERFASAARASVAIEYPDYFKLLGEHYDVVSITRNGLLSWQVRHRLPSERFTPVGAGWFRFVRSPRPQLREVRAAILPTHQGLGLYPHVLRSIRFAYGRPLVSDLEMSAANIKAWTKAGAVRPGSRLCINPPTQIQVFIAWMATEQRVPKTYRRKK